MVTKATNPITAHAEVFLLNTFHLTIIISTQAGEIPP